MTEPGSAARPLYTRIAGTQLLSEHIGDHRCRVFDGDRMLGTIEYVEIRKPDGTHYGWRPVGSRLSAHRLLTKPDAALRLTATRGRAT